MSHPDRQRMTNGRGKIIVEERGGEEQGEWRGGGKGTGKTLHAHI